MSGRGLISMLSLALILTGSARAGDPPPRPGWDQDKAVEAVEKMLATEARGQPWDEIPWIVSAEEAAARARDEDRPIFVYFYLRKDAGPAAAPG